ncbi:hypothetical protein KFE98_16970 [bacterium SCSIO 12741]|nr:hypothetical protein KFE98_16970 [bacterium SCSIO 12741]
MKIDLSDIYLLTWGELTYFEFEVNLGVQSLWKFEQNLTSSLADSLSEFKQAIESDETLKAQEPEFEGQYFYQFYGQEEQILEELRNRQNHALTLSIYSFFEGQLRSMCGLIESSFDFKIKLKDLGSQEDLMLYWNYLTKVYEINPGTLEKFFTPIKQNKVIRNAIAHQGGVLNNNQYKKADKRKEIGLQFPVVHNGYSIEFVESRFFQFLLTQMDEFLKELILCVDKRYIELTGEEWGKPAES